jgi:hypothetical protein
MPPFEHDDLTVSTSTLATLSIVFGILGFCLPLIGGFVAIICGLLALREIGQSEGQTSGRGKAIIGLALGCAGVLFGLIVGLTFVIPTVQAAREAAQRQVTANNLKQIGTALHNYHDNYKSFPSRGVIYPPERSPQDVAPQKEPVLGLSWRVRILPYIEQQPLYEQFDFNQPWDHPTNLALVDKMPNIYMSSNRQSNDGKTVYLGVTYPIDFDSKGVTDKNLLRFQDGTFFDRNPRSSPRIGLNAIRLADILDGTANTVAVVEADADQAVVWIKPDDWELDVMNPRRGLGSLRPGGFMTLFASGDIHFIPTTVDDRNLLRLFCRVDGEAIQFRDWNFQKPR